MTESAMTGRELGEKLLASVREMKAGQAARATRVAVSPIAATREAVGVSQSRFAALLGISVRTLQEWEQGRRSPTGAAKTLLRVAETHPEILRELPAGNHGHPPPPPGPALAGERGGARPGSLLPPPATREGAEWNDVPRETDPGPATSSALRPALRR